MKKLLLMIMVCLACTFCFGQEAESLTEEKSSAWIKISIPVARPATPKPATAKKTTSTVKKTVTLPNQVEAPKPQPTDEFNKTNKKVNRFKKG